MTTKLPKLPMAQLGKQGTGIVHSGYRRRNIHYLANDHHRGLVRAKMDPTRVTLRIETADQATRHTRGGRVGGGLVAGTVLLGPLGAAIGAGVGAAAKKSYADKYLIVDDGDGNAYSALLRNAADYAMAEKLLARVTEIQNAATDAR